MVAQANPHMPTAATLARGVLRLQADLGFLGLTEMTLPNGRRADIAALGPDGTVSIVEIKSSVGDFRSDTKWREYAPYCDQFYFAVGAQFPQELIPESCGLIVADGFGGAVLRPAPVTPLAAARRKVLTLRFARLAAARLLSAEAITLDVARPGA